MNKYREKAKEIKRDKRSIEIAQSIWNASRDTGTGDSLDVPSAAQMIMDFAQSKLEQAEKEKKNIITEIDKRIESCGDTHVREHNCLVSLKRFINSNK